MVEERGQERALRKLTTRSLTIGLLKRKGNETEEWTWVKRLEEVPKRDHETSEASGLI